MIAEILATGDEVRSGATVDSNSAYIASHLEEIGIEVARHTCVGDQLSILTQTMTEIAGRADVAVVTGGLGPTADDLTAEAAAAAAGLSLELHAAAWENIRRLYAQKGLNLYPGHQKQAMFPAGSVIIENRRGTAPGFVLKIGKCTFYFLPGVPHEMKGMMTEELLPDLEKRFGESFSGIYAVKTLSVFGLTESATGETIKALTDLFPGITLGLRVKFPEIQVKLYLRKTSGAADLNVLDEAGAWVGKKLGVKLLSDRGASMQECVGALLQKRRTSLAVAESCTGGLISHMLTNVPGNSNCFLFSAVTYSNTAKTGVLGVLPETLEKYGAVHEETAKEMARGVREVADADFGLSTTGIAGPGGGSAEKPVGTVCIGLSSRAETTAKKYVFRFDDRAMNKRIFAVTALNRLRLELLKNK